MYELDGRSCGPKELCTIRDNLLSDACAVIKTKMKNDPEEMNFTTLALVKGN